MAREIFVAENPDSLAREAAARFAEAAKTAIAAQGRFTVALSGGTTPRKLYDLLSQPPYSFAVDWSRVYIFFADERFLPPDDPESNFRLARETLLERVPIPQKNIFAMPTVGGMPDACAARYASVLENFFAAPLPRFDLVLLGIGPDGHTASLFPGRPDAPGIVAAVYDSPKPPPIRLTLTLAAINRAALVMFLVTGIDKAETFRDVYLGGEIGGALPAARVNPTLGETVWLVDRIVASALVKHLDS